MQTPSITAGKTVVRAKTGDKGTVLSVEGDKATVDWEGRGQRVRPTKLTYLLAPPIPSAGDIRLASAAGQRVLVNNGLHAHKYGTITSFSM